MEKELKEEEEDDSDMEKSDSKKDWWKHRSHWCTTMR